MPILDLNFGRRACRLTDNCILDTRGLTTLTLWSSLRHCASSLGLQFYDPYISTVDFSPPRWRSPPSQRALTSIGWDLKSAGGCGYDGYDRDFGWWLNRLWVGARGLSWNLPGKNVPLPWNGIVMDAAPLTYFDVG